MHYLVMITWCFMNTEIRGGSYYLTTLLTLRINWRNQLLASSVSSVAESWLAALLVQRRRGQLLDPCANTSQGLPVECNWVTFVQFQRLGKGSGCGSHRQWISLQHWVFLMDQWWSHWVVWLGRQSESVIHVGEQNWSLESRKKAGQVGQDLNAED